MTRVIKDWKPEQVEDTPVAPHRYKWDDMKWHEDYDLPDTSKPGWMKRFREAVPYQPGEVVYVKTLDGSVKRARILKIFIGQDRYGEPREEFKVQFETKAGVWSKLWEYTYPGPIQRGYQKMGLAPEMPERG